MNDAPEGGKSAENETILQIGRAARAEMPATYVDTFSSLIWNGHIRIVLGEWLDKKVNYRGAYVMELDDAKRLAEHILKRVETQYEIDAAKARDKLNPEVG